MADGSEKKFSTALFFPLNPLIKKKDNSVIPVKIKIIFLKETLPPKLLLLI